MTAKKKIDENGDAIPNFSPYTKTGHVPITMPNFQTAEFCLKGMSPLVIHKFSHKALLAMMKKQQEGDAKSKKKVHAARDFDDDFYQARHISHEGWDGIVASGFRNALIESCKLCGFKMTMAKMTIFVEADGLDSTENTPLIRIVTPTPEPYKLTSMVRVGPQKVADISVRPQWVEWGVRLRVRFDADQFTLEDVTHLVARAGLQNGIGEGRPNSRESAGQGWGMWRIVNEDDPLFAGDRPAAPRPEVVTKAKKAGAKLEAAKASLGQPEVLMTATQKRAARRKAAEVTA